MITAKDIHKAYKTSPLVKKGEAQKVRIVISGPACITNIAEFHSQDHTLKSGNLSAAVINALTNRLEESTKVEIEIVRASR